MFDATVSVAFGQISALEGGDASVPGDTTMSSACGDSGGCLGGWISGDVDTGDTLTSLQLNFETGEEEEDGLGLGIPGDTFDVGAIGGLFFLGEGVTGIVGGGGGAGGGALTALR
jgi:hypothetical protein